MKKLYEPRTTENLQSVKKAYRFQASHILYVCNMRVAINSGAAGAVAAARYAAGHSAHVIFAGLAVRIESDGYLEWTLSWICLCIGCWPTGMSRTLTLHSFQSKHPKLTRADKALHFDVHARVLLASYANIALFLSTLTRLLSSLSITIRLVPKLVPTKTPLA
eukprot:365391-Chlamydomonas_euryale.AAC.5